LRRLRILHGRRRRAVSADSAKRSATVSTVHSAMRILLCAVMALCQPPDELPFRDVESPVVLGDHGDALRLPGLALHGLERAARAAEGRTAQVPELRDGAEGLVNWTPPRIARSLVAWR